ncbi:MULTISPECIES: hypothetical protein [unclassified Chryseobacterium]|uniref:hypothetical protein n=1 Tax=unclassified Chryseobacterium TaxID=2593645 RepID=UPI00100B7F80|nr:MULTISPECIES: hypothetical protein [unclassified Chryseobacterium]RXM51376.1 hypothetical protein BOQ64_15080 [Chryseobacterium sp. CH25]RXM64986.1 hypothetical protein BOQ60_12465 [Chryseobacterium sp. CH1]
MKKLITSFSVAVVLLASCSTSAEKKVNNVDSTASKTDTVSKLSQQKAAISKVDVPEDFSELVPIDVLNTKSKNVYDKYGIEFSGNCYSCDLASLSITKNKIKWTNICDEKDALEINDFSVLGEGNKIILKTSDRTYILTQIDEAPIYELDVEGKKLESDKKRVAKYFTTQKALPLFKEHDCGNFEG